MNSKHLWGGILAAIAAVMGIVGHFVLFFQWYHIGMGADWPSRAARSC